MTAPGPNAIVEFFEQRPQMVAAILREHVPDHTGHCRACNWQQAAQPVSPCLIRHYAELAARRPRR